MTFSRLKRFVWALHTDKEFRQLGWRRGQFLRAYYRGRLQDHLRGRRVDVVCRFKVLHQVSGKSAVLNLRIGPGGGDWIVLRGVWVYQDYFHPVVTQCRTILDVGANIGMAAVWFKGVNPEAEMACVEADPRNIPLLRKNLADNGIDAKVFEYAVASNNGKARFGVGLDTGCSSLENAGLHNHSEFVEVETRRLPEILDNLGWAEVDLLKMDIEGLERDLLADSDDWLHRVKYIVLEIHQNTSIEEIASLLNPAQWTSERLGRVAEETYLLRPVG